MSLFTAIATIIRTRQISLPLFGRQLLIRFDPQAQPDPVDHVLWNIVGFDLSGSVDRYSAQVEGFVAVLGFTVNLDLAFSAIGTGGANLTIETPLFTLYLTVGTYLAGPEVQPVRTGASAGLLLGADVQPCAHANKEASSDGSYVVCADCGIDLGSAEEDHLD